MDFVSRCELNVSDGGRRRGDDRDRAVKIKCV